MRVHVPSPRHTRHRTHPPLQVCHVLEHCLKEHQLYARGGQKWGHIGQGVIVYNTTEIESTLCGWTDSNLRGTLPPPPSPLSQRVLSRRAQVLARGHDPRRRRLWQICLAVPYVRRSADRDARVVRGVPECGGDRLWLRPRRGGLDHRGHVLRDAHRLARRQGEVVRGAHVRAVAVQRRRLRQAAMPLVRDAPRTWRLTRPQLHSSHLPLLPSTQVRRALAVRQVEEPRAVAARLPRRPRRELGAVPAAQHHQLDEHPPRLLAPAALPRFHFGAVRYPVLRVHARILLLLLAVEPHPRRRRVAHALAHAGAPHPSVRGLRGVRHRARFDRSVEEVRADAEEVRD